jgi:two-component system, chemotaxis family, CheB/CheR fusion protein
MPELIADTERAREIRVWSAGCASGEEAYSLAMAFAEALGVDECAKRVKIYATDIDEEVLRDARAGLYQARALESLPGELRDKYFEETGTHFAFRPDLRRRVIFGRHDITRDAPISRLDLLVCRNTLMYFNVETQSHVIDRFHFAVREGGYLFLGKAEMLLLDGNRFEVVSMRQRIFRRRPGTGVPRYPSVPIKLDVIGGQEARELGKKRQLQDLALETAPFAVAGLDTEGIVVLLNNQLRAMFGLTARDLGRPFHELEISYRPVELRSLIEQAYTEHRVVRVSAVERPLGPAEVQYLDIHIQPLWGSDGLRAGVLLMFIDTSVVTRLQLEISRSKEDLDTVHEELQSTNEELEAANEELQSSIEELETMNEEMQLRTAELDEARTFLEGVLSSVAAGVVVLDAELMVRSWNQGAEELWGLRADEVRNQAFFNLDFGLPTADVHDIVQHCLKSGLRAGPVQVRAINRIGRTITCTVTCSPLRGGSEGDSEGAVLLMEESYPGLPGLSAATVPPSGCGRFRARPLVRTPAVPR